MLGSDPINVAVATTGSRDSRGSRCSRFGSDPINVAEQQAAMSPVSSPATSEDEQPDWGRPSWEALTEAFVPGSRPEVRIFEVDSEHNSFPRVTLIVDVAGREAYVSCIVRLAQYTGRPSATGSQEEQRARSRSPRRDTTQEEPPPGSSRGAQNDEQRCSERWADM